MRITMSTERLYGEAEVFRIIRYYDFYKEVRDNFRNAKEDEKKSLAGSLLSQIELVRTEIPGSLRKFYVLDIGESALSKLEQECRTFFNNK